MRRLILGTYIIIIIIEAGGVHWTRVAQDRSLWHSVGKAYVQQWTYNMVVSNFT
jgi:hypothetical protein